MGKDGCIGGAWDKTPSLPVQGDDNQKLRVGRRLFLSYGHASAVGEFISTAEDALIGRLTRAVASTEVPSQRTAKVEAWKLEIRLLKE